MKVDAADPSDDFSTAPALVDFRQVRGSRLMRNSGPTSFAPGPGSSFAPEILNSSISFQAQREVKSLVNSEGSRLQHGRTYARILIVARAKAYGMDLATSDTIEAEEPGRLPDSKIVEARIDKVIADLRGLLKASIRF